MLETLKRFIDQWFLILGVITALVGGWLYIESFSQRLDSTLAAQQDIAQQEEDRDRQWMLDETDEHGQMAAMLDIALTTQGEIRLELTAQTQQLQRLIDEGDYSFSQRENRFEQIEDGQARIIDSLVIIGFNMGYNTGQHDAEEQQK